MEATSAASGLVIGRYVLFDEIASGGMATVHLGRLCGAVGFSRTVAIKRLHPQLARDVDFVGMFLDEARIAARIRHPNVVSVLDVVHEGGELFLVMDYVQGESLARLVRAIRPGIMPPRVAVTVLVNVLHGLHAAHDATSEHGEPLGIVHRDVSPQNILVGSDGGARVLDFGVAKAAHRAQTTSDGAIKGKISYMAPEQLLSETVDRRADVYAAAVVLWEALTGTRLFDGDNQGRVVRKILDEPIAPPSSVVPGLPKPVDDAVMRGLERDVERRWQSAREFASALENALPPATATMIGEWVESIAGTSLMDRARRVKEIESRSEIVASTVAAAREEATTRVASERKIAITGPTVPAAFAVMSPPPEAVDVRFSSAPPPDPEPEPEAPRDDEPRLTSSARFRAASPIAPMPVQTLAITPLASLDPTPLTPITPVTPAVPLAPEPVEQSAPDRGRRALLLGILLAALGILAVIAAITWTLLRAP